MKKQKSFHEAKTILVFEGSSYWLGVLISLRGASRLTHSSLPTLSSACSGAYSQADGHYYRHIDIELLIELIVQRRLFKLTVYEFDRMRNDLYRKYLPEERMTRKNLAITSRTKRNNKIKRNGK